jgi:hypothetical protein
MTTGGDPLGALQSLLGADIAAPLPAESAGRYLVDHRRLYQGRALALVRPRETSQVAQLLRWCHEQRIGVVPQGGNTSYCGGATPDVSGQQVLLSLERMNRIRRLDGSNALALHHDRNQRAQRLGGRAIGPDLSRANPRGDDPDLVSGPGQLGAAPAG